MNPLERALAILLLLTRRRLLPASELGARFEVSVRTIYRDIDRLLALGIPIEAERGVEGGFRLSGDYLSPPIALNRLETTALLVALALVRGLETTPLKGDLETAEAKLLAAMPKAAREVLARGPNIVGIEKRPDDIFHGRRPSDQPGDYQVAVDRFLEGVLNQRRVELRHKSPSHPEERAYDVEPHGLLWDRDLWYLVGRSLSADDIRMWRADRIRGIRVTGMAFRPPADFDVRTMLGRQWLERAMRIWDTEKQGSRIRLGADAAARLKLDWFYRHAAYIEGDDGHVLMSLSDTDPQTVFPLVRWLGAEAEILEPAALRERFRSELDALRNVYA